MIYLEPINKSDEKKTELYFDFLNCHNRNRYYIGTYIPSKNMKRVDETPSSLVQARIPQGTLRRPC